MKCSSSTSKYFVGVKFALGEHSHLDGFKCFKEVLDKDNVWRKLYARHNRREITSICMRCCNPRAISYYREKGELTRTQTQDLPLRVRFYQLTSLLLVMFYNTKYIRTYSSVHIYENISEKTKL